MDIAILQIIWFFLLGILFMGYSVLDGFDLGIGSLFPFLAKSDEKKQELLIRSIGPVWDGNEVWLITAGGALFAAFPHAYATVFSGFYLALMIVLFGLILRAISIEFFIIDSDNRKIWSATFFMGSFIPSILFGVALGNVIQGVPLDASMEYRGSFLTLLRPFPLSCGLLGFTAILMQGLTYTGLKNKGELKNDAYKIAGKITYVYAFLFFITMLLGLIFIDGSYKNIGAWFFAVMFLVSLTAVYVNIIGEKEVKSFIFSSLSFVSLWGIVGSVQFPALVRSSVENIGDITIYNASSGRLTLLVMFGFAIIGMPMVVAYSIYVYRIYKGKISI